jgi:hypothetical protein
MIMKTMEYQILEQVSLFMNMIVSEQLTEVNIIVLLLILIKWNTS